MKYFCLRKFLKEEIQQKGPTSGKNICLTVGTSQNTVFIVGGMEEVSEGHNYLN